jgi:DNA-binding XRE family transcriptional regulator
MKKNKIKKGKLIPLEEHLDIVYNTPEKRKKFDEGYKKQVQIWKAEAQAELANVIRTAREQSGLTQEELAKRLGVTRTNVVSIESGKRNLTIETFQKTARAMGKQLVITIK